MGRLCRYLVEQRHYFPLFPPTDRSKLPKTGTEEGVATGAVLDLSYLELGEMVNVRPDVMIVPSLLPPFAKVCFLNSDSKFLLLTVLQVVESVLLINPGYLSKRRGAGTYARMALYPPSVSGGSDAMMGHQIFDRARVEIVRI
jgi:DNA polymerase alpha subunit B